LPKLWSMGKLACCTFSVKLAGGASLLGHQA
jgi:hypothetical protein